MTWFDLPGDARLSSCATDGCGGQPTKRLESGGYGANYCSGCAAYIAALPAASEPAAWAEVMGGKVYTVRLDRSRHCTEPLYFASVLVSLQARVMELEAALRRQKANIEHWLATGEAAGPEESKSIYNQICAALQEADHG